MCVSTRRFVGFLLLLSFFLICLVHGPKGGGGVWVYYHEYGARLIEGRGNSRTCTSSLYTSTYSQLMPEFGTSRLICTLGLSMFVAGLGTGPMILSPLSEACTILSRHSAAMVLPCQCCRLKC